VAVGHVLVKNYSVMVHWACIQLQPDLVDTAGGNSLASPMPTSCAVVDRAVPFAAAPAALNAFASGTPPTQRSSVVVTDLGGKVAVVTGERAASARHMRVPSMRRSPGRRGRHPTGRRRPRAVVVVGPNSEFSATTSLNCAPVASVSDRSKSGMSGAIDTPVTTPMRRPSSTSRSRSGTP
jgi:hypothetical protein